MSAKRTIDERRAARKALDARRAKAGPGWDAKMYGPAWDGGFSRTSDRCGANRRPNAQRYPSGCRRLFRAHRITPTQAAKGKIPEACR